MELVPTAQYHHAQYRCFLCPNVDDLVDTGVLIEGEGVLAICHSCVRQMADLWGIAEGDAAVEIEQLAALVESQTQQISTLTRRERALRGQIKGMKDRIETKEREAQGLRMHVEVLDRQVKEMERIDRTALVGRNAGRS